MTGKSPTVTILIISYNTRDMTLACLKSVYDQEGGRPFDVVVVDNDSDDGSADEVERLFPQVRLIRSSENLGFGRANNLAAKTAKSDLILLLNPDTIVLDHAVDRLVCFAQSHDGSQIWGGRTVYEDGSLNPASCWRDMSLWAIFSFSVGLSSLFPNIFIFNPEAYGGWKRDSVREVDIVTGCFLLIKRDLWDKLRGFDESFFMYAEEADLCHRARRLGARPLFTPDATIIHYGGASETIFSEKVCRLFRGKISYLYKHWPPMKRNAGIALFKLAVFSRALGYGAVAQFTRSARHRRAADEWAIVWSMRHQWSKGYGQDITPA